VTSARIRPSLAERGQCLLRGATPFWQMAAKMAVLPRQWPHRAGTGGKLIVSKDGLCEAGLVSGNG
jgi:hypothetical protein